MYKMDLEPWDQWPSKNMGCPKNFSVRHALVYPMISHGSHFIVYTHIHIIYQSCVSSPVTYRMLLQWLHCKKILACCRICTFFYLVNVTWVFSCHLQTRKLCSIFLENLCSILKIFHLLFHLLEYFLQCG